MIGHPIPSHKKDRPPSPPPAIELAEVGVVDITDAPDDIEERRLPLMEDRRGVIAWISVAVLDSDDFPDDALPDDEEEALTSVEEGRI